MKGPARAAGTGPAPQWRYRGHPGVVAPLDSADVTTADYAGSPADGRHQLPPQYAPGDVESRRYEGWVQAGYFTADAASPAPPLTRMIPPPNVPGSLPIGPALHHTLVDAPIRRARVPGSNAPGPPRAAPPGLAP